MNAAPKLPGGLPPLGSPAKTRKRSADTTNAPAIHDDIDPCTELRGHTAKLIFTPSDAKWLNGELVHVEIEKKIAVRGSAAPDSSGSLRLACRRGGGAILKELVTVHHSLDLVCLQRTQER